MKSFFALLLLSPIVFAQADPPSPFPQPQQQKFEIADVHVSTTAPGFAQNVGGQLHEGLYTNRDSTMLSLITAAYGVPEEVVAGGPGWITSDLFDVIAKVPSGATPATANLMLQGLLADRFGLVVHNETRPLPRYVLTIGKGSKLRRAKETEETGCDDKQTYPATVTPAGPGDFSQVPNNKLSCHGMSTADLAVFLRNMASGYLTYDVVDRTGLEGSWDFDLEWTPRVAFGVRGPEGISVFDAVEKQLGLKLQLQNVPQPTLAILSVNRRPTPNPSNLATALALSEARFEVAVIKPADPNGQPLTEILSRGTQLKAGGTLRSLLALTLEITPNIAADTILGLPKSAETQAWDITAKLPTTGEGSPLSDDGHFRPVPNSVALEMLRGMLVDQFELKTHTESREVTVYALTASGKPKLVRADESERTGCSFIQNPAKPGQLLLGTATCKNTSMDDLSQYLAHLAQGYIDHPIVNATSLEGGWDFDLSWTPLGLLRKARAADQSADGAATPEAPALSGITLFEAVERQLGLKLVKQKRSIPVVVVDHVDEKPLN